MDEVERSIPVELSGSLGRTGRANSNSEIETGSSLRLHKHVTDSPCAVNGYPIFNPTSV